TERMQQRPIGILADALQTLGANIEYAENAGFPPLKIEGGMTQQQRNEKIQGNVSSQYLSYLLLISPSLEEGLILEIQYELTSRPYVTMTLNMLDRKSVV